MLFLIQYDPAKGELVKICRFEDNQKKSVGEERLTLEIKLNRQGKHHEVVILQAENEAALRRTHRRYFEDLIDIMTLENAQLPISA